MSDERLSLKYKKKRSRILYLITALIIVVFIAYGLATWFIFRGSQDRLVEKSKEKLIETEAENINSAADYIVELLLPLFEEAMGDMTDEEFAMSVMNQEVIEAQRIMAVEIEKMMEAGLLGLDEIIYVMLPGTFISEPYVLLSSDESLIYTWEVPEHLLEGAYEGTTYFYTEGGIPELDLQGKYLITIEYIESDTGSDSVVYTVKNMEEKVAVLDDFFSDEQSNINLVMGLVIFGSIIVVILITFFILSYMIRKRITDPVDELVAAAEQINEGNLDVEIQVHEGGDFEGLERAFKQMVDSWREYIDKSVGD
jgi:nitrogen fixation/metabolism regulation signal transduction histidine kinase